MLKLCYCFSVSSSDTDFNIATPLPRSCLPFSFQRILQNKVKSSHSNFSAFVMLQQLSRLLPYLPYTEASFSLSSNRKRIRTNPNHPANMSHDEQDFEIWFAKARKQYFGIIYEARDADDIIWNYPVSDWMRDGKRPHYEIWWGDGDCLRRTLVCDFEFTHNVVVMLS